MSKRISKSFHNKKHKTQTTQIRSVNTFNIKKCWIHIFFLKLVDIFSIDLNIFIWIFHTPTISKIFILTFQKLRGIVCGLKTLSTIFIGWENWLLDTESDHSLLLDIQNRLIC